MRDDLFCFTYLGHRVSIALDGSPMGWSFTIDGAEDAKALTPICLAQRLLLEEAGIAARDHIRSMQAAGMPAVLPWRMPRWRPEPCASAPA